MDAFGQLFDPSPTGEHSAYKQKEAEATQCTQTGYAPVNGLEAFHNLRWGSR